MSAAAIRDFQAVRWLAELTIGFGLQSGTFSAAAVIEATRAGAPPIDLVDGAAFAEKLSALCLGVSLEVVANVSANEDYGSSTYERSNKRIWTPPSIENDVSLEKEYFCFRSGI